MDNIIAKIKFAAFNSLNSIIDTGALITFGVIQVKRMNSRRFVMNESEQSRFSTSTAEQNTRM